LLGVFGKILVVGQQLAVNDLNKKRAFLAGNLSWNHNYGSMCMSEPNAGTDVWK
jgi:alkylation response protein AidB-like acyl-CoA dehydrogenase